MTSADMSSKTRDLCVKFPQEFHHGTVTADKVGLKNKYLVNYRTKVVENRLAVVKEEVFEDKSSETSETQNQFPKLLEDKVYKRDKRFFRKIQGNDDDVMFNQCLTLPVVQEENENVILESSDSGESKSSKKSTNSSNSDSNEDINDESCGKSSKEKKIKRKVKKSHLELKKLNSESNLNILTNSNPSYKEGVEVDLLNDLTSKRNLHKNRRKRASGCLENFFLFSETFDSFFQSSPPMSHQFGNDLLVIRPITLAAPSLSEPTYERPTPFDRSSKPIVHGVKSESHLEILSPHHVTLTRERGFQPRAMRLSGGHQTTSKMETEETIRRSQEILRRLLALFQYWERYPQVGGERGRSPQGLRAMLREIATRIQRLRFFLDVRNTDIPPLPSCNFTSDSDKPKTTKSVDKINEGIKKPEIKRHPREVRNWESFPRACQSLETRKNGIPMSKLHTGNEGVNCNRKLRNVAMTEGNNTTSNQKVPRETSGGGAGQNHISLNHRPSCSRPLQQTFGTEGSLTGQVQVYYPQNSGAFPVCPHGNYINNNNNSTFQCPHGRAWNVYHRPSCQFHWLSHFHSPSVSSSPILEASVRLETSSPTRVPFPSLPALAPCEKPPSSGSLGFTPRFISDCNSKLNQPCESKVPQPLAISVPFPNDNTPEIPPIVVNSSQQTSNEVEVKPTCVSLVDKICQLPCGHPSPIPCSSGEHNGYTTVSSHQHHHIVERSPSGRVCVHQCQCTEKAQVKDEDKDEDTRPFTTPTPPGSLNGGSNGFNDGLNGGLHGLIGGSNGVSNSSDRFPPNGKRVVFLPNCPNGHRHHKHTFPPASEKK